MNHYKPKIVYFLKIKMVGFYVKAGKKLNELYVDIEKVTRFTRPYCIVSRALRHSGQKRSMTPPHPCNGVTGGQIFIEKQH